MIKVLVADSQLLMAQGLRVALALEAGLEVVEEDPANGLAAVEAVVQHTPDVAVMDYWLKGMEGPAAIRMIQKRAPDQKVILLGWFHEPGKANEAAVAGAWAFLSKDDRLPELVSAIRQVHEGRRLLKTPGIRVEEAGVPEPSDEAWRGLLKLTPREVEILSRLAVSGRPDEVAKELSITTATMRLHIQNILKKTGARSHVEVVVMARQRGLI